MPQTADQNPPIRKIENVFSLSQDERRALDTLPMQVQALRPHQDIVREGDRPSRSFVLLDGYTATFTMTGDGKRQIQAFHVPGDVPDLHSLHLKVLDNGISTLTRVGSASFPPRPCEICAGSTPVSWRRSGVRPWSTAR